MTQDTAPPAPSTDTQGQPLDRLMVSSEVFDEVMEHARRALPYEACGLLAGADGLATRAYALINTDGSAVSYLAEPNGQLRAMRKIEADGLELLAIYHSHPTGPAVPSAVDVIRAFFPGTSEPNFPGTASIIIGLGGEAPEIRAYVIDGSGTMEIELLSVAT